MSVLRGRVTGFFEEDDQRGVILEIKDLATNLTLRLCAPGIDTLLRKGQVLEFKIGTDPAKPSLALLHATNAVQHGAAVGDEMWKQKLRRWENRCAKCRETFLPKDLTQGHLLPASRGGRRTAGNLVPLCISCNQADKNTLCWYELIAEDRHLRPDEETRILLMREAQRTGEAIHRTITFTFYPIGRRVEVAAEIDEVHFESGRLRGLEFQGRSGIFHHLDDESGECWIAMDMPALAETANGVIVPCRMVLVRTDHVLFQPSHRDVA